MSEDVKERFQINDLTSANWAFQRLAEAKKKLDKIEKQREAYEQQTQHWYEDATKSPKNDIDYFNGLLEEYRQTVPDKKFKTPAGEAKVRKTTQYEYKDDDLLAYLKQTHPDLVKTTEKAQWGEFKKTLKPTNDGKVITKEDGELIPFIQAHVTESVKFEPDMTYLIGGDLNE